jgi:uncharacterized protein (DUF2147 family)
MTKLLRLALAAATLSGLAAISAPAHAQDAIGTWQRDNGESRVRISKCGNSLCGTVVWIKNQAESKSKIGLRVFYDMTPNGEKAWVGKAFNPEDQKVYSGKMTLSGNTLTTSGCIVGGLICRSVSWSRVN